jgi:2-oxoglutarate ferredoxin oxidoreductase subunit gamma
MISDDEILFPYVESPEVLLCMSQEGYSKNVEHLVEDGILLWDSDLVKTGKHKPGWITYDIPSTRFAEELGNTMMANIVMLGFLSSVSDVVKQASLRESVLRSVPPHTKEKNGKAFDRGYDYGNAILESKARKSKTKESDA